MQKVEKVVVVEDNDVLGKVTESYLKRRRNSLVTVAHGCPLVETSNTMKKMARVIYFKGQHLSEQ